VRHQEDSPEQRAGEVTIELYAVRGATMTVVRHPRRGPGRELRLQRVRVRRRHLHFLPLPRSAATRSDGGARVGLLAATAALCSYWQRRQRVSERVGADRVLGWSG